MMSQSPARDSKQRSGETELPGRVLVATFAVFAVSVAFLGGSSRYDNWQLIILQPVAWLAAGYFLLVKPDHSLRNMAMPAILLFGLLILMVVQLIPLPTSLWASLPGRDVVAALDTAREIEQTRPISLVPSRTVNALANLAVPICGLLVFAALGTSRIRLVTLTLLAFGGLNAIVALIQILGPGGEWFYFYHGRNNGAAVGLFANRNHSGVFGAVMLIFIAATIAQLDAHKDRRRVLLLYGLYGLIFLLALVSGSRAGLICTMIGLGATATILLKTPQSGMRAKARRRRTGWVAGLLTAGAGFAIALVFIMANRLPAFDQFIAQDPLGDLRFAITPTLVDMAWTYFPVGSGFGSLEQVYYIHEPNNLLQGAYLNMAHNDWLQLVIEAGLPGLVLLVAALAWVIKLVFGLLGHDRTAQALALMAGLAVTALASYFDYSLRTPLFQLSVLWLLLIAHDRSRLAR